MINSNTIIQAEGFFPSEQRWIFYRRFESPLHKGDFLAIHGGLEHSGRYEELGSILARNGYNVYMLDLTGFGRSQNQQNRRGYIHKFDDYLVDLINFYAFLQKHKQMKIPFLFGHSMGGLLATLCAAWGKCPIKGLVLSAPLFGLKTQIPFFKRWFIRWITLIYPHFSIPTPIQPNLLTHDEQIAEEYATDPFILQEINGHWLMELISTINKIYLAAPYIKMPCLVFHGEQDSIADPQATKKFFANINSQRKDFYLVRGAYHEVFNEKGRAQLIVKFLEWLHKLPPGI